MVQRKTTSFIKEKCNKLQVHSVNSGYIQIQFFLIKNKQQEDKTKTFLL